MVLVLIRFLDADFVCRCLWDAEGHDITRNQPQLTAGFGVKDYLTQRESSHGP